MNNYTNLKNTINKLEVKGIIHLHEKKSGLIPVTDDVIYKHHIDDGTIAVLNKDGVYILNENGDILNDKPYKTTTKPHYGLRGVKSLSGKWGCIDNTGALMSEGLVYDKILYMDDMGYTTLTKDSNEYKIRLVTTSDEYDHMYNNIKEYIEPDFILDDTVNYKMVSILHSILKHHILQYAGYYKKEESTDGNVTQLNAFMKDDANKYDVVSEVFRVKDFNFRNSIYEAYRSISTFMVNMTNPDEIELLHRILSNGTINYNNAVDYKEFCKNNHLDILYDINNNYELEYSDELYHDIIGVLSEYYILANVQVEDNIIRTIKY